MRSDPEARTALTIVGPGRLGRSIHRAAIVAGIDARLAGRDDAAKLTRGAEIVLLCVPDSSIASACESIIGSTADRPVAMGHTSGATPLSALRAAEEAGAGVFSLHPLQTIPDGETNLAGTPCAVSAGSPGMQTRAGKLASALEMIPFSVPEESRVAYHAAASIASNFLVALEEAAAGLLEGSGIPDGRALLSPLVLQTARNWTERGADALTGPISRGDHETVERHMAAIATLGDPALESAYSSLAVLTERISPNRVASPV